MSHVWLPPNGTLLVPSNSRRSFRSSLTLWATCRPKARALRSVLYWGTGALGTLGLRLLPSGSLQGPATEGKWDAFASVWEDWFGPFDTMALYRPRQEERQGFVALLIRAGRAIGFAKARPGWDFSDEATTVRSLAGSRTFSTPGFVGLAEVEDWAMIGFEPLPPGLHSPRLRSADAAAITAEIGERLVPGRAERPHDHWQPMHGDLGPWNLRWLRGTGPVVFDWEEASFGPPGADLVFHTAASLAMRIKHRGVDLGSYPEAVEYWRTAIPRRFGQSGADSALARQMVAALSPS